MCVCVWMKHFQDVFLFLQLLILNLKLTFNIYLPCLNSIFINKFTYYSFWKFPFPHESFIFIYLFLLTFNANVMYVCKYNICKLLFFINLFKYLKHLSTIFDFVFKSTWNLLFDRDALKLFHYSFNMIYFLLLSHLFFFIYARNYIIH